MDLPICSFLDIAKLSSMKVIPDYSSTAVDENVCFPLLLPTKYVAKLLDLEQSMQRVCGIWGLIKEKDMTMRGSSKHELH